MAIGVVVVVALAFDVTKVKEAKNELQKALREIKTLRKILPICSYCKKIRNDEDYWQTVENYISMHTDAKFSPSICPACYDARVELPAGQSNENPTDAD